MEQERRRAPAQGIRAIFASLRVQIIVLLVLCYLIPVLVLSVFIQSTLLPRMWSTPGPWPARISRA